MNAFAERHSGSIRFGYSCFDRLLLNAVIQVLQSPASIVWFLREHRGVPRLSREYFRCVPVEYHQWVEELALRWSVPIVTPPKKVRRNAWLEGFYRRRLREPTVSESGRRTPGLKLDDPRLLALMQALVRFAPLASGGAFRTKNLHEHAAAAQGKTTEAYTLSQLRYDLGKLRAKSLVQKVAGTQTYRLAPEGYRLCVLFLKLFHKVDAPLASATLAPIPRTVSGDPLPPRDRLYAAVDRALQELCTHVGLKLAA